MTSPTAVLLALPPRGWGTLPFAPSDMTMMAMVAAGWIHAQRTPTAWQARLTGNGRRLRQTARDKDDRYQAALTKAEGFGWDDPVDLQAYLSELNDRTINALDGEEK